MFLTRTKAKNSAIHGLGCFTEEALKKGQLVWEFLEGMDARVRMDRVAGYPAAVREFLKVYGYVDARNGERYQILCGDDARFMNHSTTPNIVDLADGSSVAARDIAVGEELTCDYSTFDADFEGKFNS